MNNSEARHSIFGEIKECAYNQDRYLPFFPFTTYYWNSQNTQKNRWLSDSSESTTRKSWSSVWGRQMTFFLIIPFHCFLWEIKSNDHIIHDKNPSLELLNWETGEVADDKHAYLRLAYLQPCVFFGSNCRSGLVVVYRLDVRATKGRKMRNVASRFLSLALYTWKCLKKQNQNQKNYEPTHHDISLFIWHHDK